MLFGWFDPVKKLEKQRARKSQVLLASGVPTTTAMRYFSVLQDRGLVTSEQCQSDNRVQFVYLTPEGTTQMSRCMATHLRAEHAVLASPNDAIEGMKRRSYKPDIAFEN